MSQEQGRVCVCARARAPPSSTRSPRPLICTRAPQLNAPNLDMCMRVWEVNGSGKESFTLLHEPAAMALKFTQALSRCGGVCMYAHVYVYVYPTLSHVPIHLANYFANAFYFLHLMPPMQLISYLASSSFHTST